MECWSRSETSALSWNGGLNKRNAKHIFCIDFHNLMGYFNMGNLLTNQRFENNIKSLKRIYRRLAVDDHNE
jgi:hypothetical protein